MAGLTTTLFLTYRDSQDYSQCKTYFGGYKDKYIHMNCLSSSWSLSLVGPTSILN